MVCARCARLSKGTSLATPSVKRKTELYYGSSASSSAAARDKSLKSATQGNAGIGKSKLLSKAAKNPYAVYSASCEQCKLKIDQGRRYCQSCAFKKNACAVCGKSMTASASSMASPASAGKDGKTSKTDARAARQPGIPEISGQRFSAK